MKTTIFLMGIIFAAVFTSCTQNEPGTGIADGKVKLNIRLTDAPADYQEVNIDLLDVQINAQDGDKGWTSLGGVKPGIYNLLDFTGGVDTLIASDYLPAGYYSQIRLVLGDNNSIKGKMGGNDFERGMKVPSGSTSGLKLNLHQELVEGAGYTVLLDFDAARSIVAKGNGEFSLKPVIRMSMEAQTGAISGTVDPASSKALVYIYETNPADTIATTYINDLGQYMLKGIEPGTFVLHVDPSDENIAFKEVAGVTVVKGQVTKVPVVTIP